MGSFTNWLRETFRTGDGRRTVEAAATKMESLEPRLLLSGITWQGPIINIGAETAHSRDTVAVATDAAANSGTDTTTLVSSSTYQDIVGIPPNPATLAFSDWCNELLAARQNEIAAPTATYYFAAGGDDDTGDGGMAHPWRSIAKANTMLAGDNVQCLFNRGDEWPSSVGLTLAGNDTSVGDYGDPGKPKPLIDCFTHTIPTSTAWTQANGTNDYTYVVNSGTGWLTPAWIRDKDRRFDAYAWMGTAAAMTSGGGQAGAIAAAIRLVENTPYSWFYDPTTYLLHVNAGGTNPATITWEWSDTAAVAQHGVNIEKTGYVSGLRTDGWGCGAALGDSVSQHWGIVFTGGFGTSAVVEDCEAYNNGRHNIGSLGAGANALTVIDCVVGYTNNTDAEGTSAYVGYSSGGSNESIFWNCSSRFGDLPWSGGPLSGWTNNDVFVTHCGSGTIGLALVWGMSTTGETSWHNATWANGSYYCWDPNLPGTAGAMDTVRTWVVNSSYDVPSAPKCGNYVGGGLGGAATKGVLINARQRVTLSAANAYGATRFIYYSPASFNLNESIDIFDPNGGPALERDIEYMTGTTINQSLRITCGNPATLVVQAGSGYLLNSVLSVVGSTSPSTGIYLPTSHSKNNAYAGFADYRTGTEAGKVSLMSAVDPLAIPYPGSALYQAGTGTVMDLGAALGYDTNWNPRPTGTPSIGAVEGAAMPGDANNDGKVDVTDLGILAKNYDTTNVATWAMGDFNGDGAVDVVDLGILAKNYGWVGAAAGGGAAQQPLALSLPAQTGQDAVGASGQAPAGAQSGSLQPLSASQLVTAREYSPDVPSAGSALDMVSLAPRACGVAPAAPIIARVALIQARPLNLLAIVAARSGRTAAQPVLAERDAAPPAATLGGELDLLSLDNLGL